MSKIQFGARIVIGLIYFVFGGMGLGLALGLYHVNFPSMGSQAADAFIHGLMGSGYFLLLLKITETSCGFLMLTGIAAPLALVIIAPVTVNIICFHFFLTPGLNNLVLPGIMVLCQILAMSAYWNKYKALLKK